MKYEKVRKGHFLLRPNRFVAQVELDGEEVTCHVKNTGRCKELLVPGATVYLEDAPGQNRQTKYDLIGVEKGSRLINMDSMAPNGVFYEWAMEKEPFPSLTRIKREHRFEDSRLDFLLETDESKLLVEVKGVTLEEDGIARFPDAPTLRGVKHLETLMRALELGYDAMLFFVIQMEGVSHFEPNDKTHPAFAAALRRAKAAGVRLEAYDCRVTPDTLCISKPVPIRL